MANPVARLAKSMRPFRNARKTYKKLRKHLNEQPVGFPSTLTGVELRLLEDLFTTTEADVALSMTYEFENFETIYSKAHSKGYSKEVLMSHLDEMEKKGGIAVRSKNGEQQYSLHPFVVGMFEMCLDSMTPGFYLDMANYMLSTYSFEYLMTEVPQMRVIPVNRSIEVKQNVSTYDQIRHMVEQSGDRISIQDCICKKGKDLISDPCRTTERREVCMTFGDIAETSVRRGSGRMVAQKEALEILDQSEKDGLVLMTSAPQDPEFVCACCRCCCGPITMMKMMPRPVDFAASNYQAHASADTCNGCQKCLKRCPMKAVQFDFSAKRVTKISEERCIGCGLCVATCKTESLQMVRKTKEFVPPKNHDELFEVLRRNKKSPVAKAVKVAKAMMGKEV